MKNLTRLGWFLLALLPFSAQAEKEYAGDMANFEKSDQAAMPEKGGLLFVGSSSIRMWDLAKSFPEKKAINRGFGGSQLHHTLENFDLLVLRHKPAAVFLYAGDNDINAGKSVEDVVSDYQKIAAAIHETLPETHLVFIPIKPSLARWEMWPKMEKANEKIKALTEDQPHLHFLETHHALLGPDGKPVPEFYQKDGLHLTEEGYAKWNAIVKAWLEKEMAKSKTR